MVLFLHGMDDSIYPRAKCEVNNIYTVSNVSNSALRGATSSLACVYDP